MECRHFEAGRCRSCTLLPLAHSDQVATKVSQVTSLLPPMQWSEPVRGAESAFRNKAKMVVAGPVEAPTLGILSPAGRGIDLQDCGLHEPALRDALPAIAAFVTRAGLTPYDVSVRRGELKHVLVTVSPDRELMLRLVVRSTECEARVRKHLPSLLDHLAALRVVSLNIQPEHKAVIEGPREILLTGAATLPMRVNGLTLHLRPGSFFQTNTELAAALYARARDWADAGGPTSVLDLYCGVGGFALHLASAGREVVGVEASGEAVVSARLSALEAGQRRAWFVAADATAYALGLEEAPELVVVNPPRRGIGAELAGWLESSGVRQVLYSSCNAATLARDLTVMPSLRPRRGVLLDMFPQTRHYEVLVQLTRN